MIDRGIVLVRDLSTSMGLKSDDGGHGKLGANGCWGPPGD